MTVMGGEVIVAGVSSSNTGKGKPSTSSEDTGSVLKWDLATGVPVGPPHREYSGGPGSSPCPCAVAHLPTGLDLRVKGFVALHSQKMALNYYLLSKERPIHRFFGQDQLSALAFSPDGEVLVAGNETGKLYGWDIKSGEMIFTVMDAHYQRVVVTRFSVDGLYLVSGSADGTVKVWRWARLLNGQEATPEISFADHTKAVTDVHVGFGVDRNFRLLTSSLDATVLLYDMIDGQLMAKFEFPSPINTVTMTSVEMTILAAAEDGNIYLVDLGKYDAHDLNSINSITHDASERQDFFCLRGHRAVITSMALSVDETVVVSGDSSGLLIVWNLISRQHLRRITCSGAIDLFR